jgi:5'-nucleotidase
VDVDQPSSFPSTTRYWAAFADPLQRPIELEPALSDVPKQLVLPLPELMRIPESTAIPRNQRVFVNRHLRTSEIDWIGFDMDYTLIIYNQPEMDRLQIEKTIPRVIQRGYPEYLADIDYPIKFPIRGLMIDKKLGHVLKMDRYKIVQKAYHGLRELSVDEIHAAYHEKKIRLTAQRYHWIDTLYALSEVAMYAAIVDALEAKRFDFDYAKLFEDIRESIDECHRNFIVQAEMLKDLPRYVHRDDLLAATLHKWRSAGKKLFVLTNSGPSYTETMMDYLLGDAMSEYPSWKHYFDVLITAAAKPAFFQERRPLMERDGEILRVANGPLERGKLYENGNLHDLEAMLGVGGDRILYVGDHIYGDMLRSKKDSAWRTVMIIQEMVAEISAYEQCSKEIVTLHVLEDRRQQSEENLRLLQHRFKETSRRVESYANGSKGFVPLAVLEAEKIRIKRQIDQQRANLRSLDREIHELEMMIDKEFHPYWGSILKESHEVSSFGRQVDEYACLYTSKVSNFVNYSPLHFYRSPRERMPHEM